MLNNKTLLQFNLKDIVERKIEFTINNNIFDKVENQAMEEGELLAYNQILVDIEIMGENEFVDKYLAIIKKIRNQFERQEILNEKEIEKMSGYNNAIVSILELIDPIHKYDLEDDLI